MLVVPQTAVSDTLHSLSARARVFRYLAASHGDLKNFVSHLDGPDALSDNARHPERGCLCLWDMPEFPPPSNTLTFSGTHSPRRVVAVSLPIPPAEPRPNATAYQDIELSA